ncbi:phosphonatase-like hydrolase [Fulvivirga kasyanovii]|uniref:HAD family hydrolase n=1 Tax=Fulvivirga kasyanovii TaxID=396812 RepID=A0ABW9RTI5_9BACT|nr:HAD-IA family hydrolase [Fulvivirga kasyanovii]MTI26997.1 HAD family hydrolase [Fulvivirga kasyanovii]
MSEIKLVVFDMAGTTVHDNRNVHQVLKAALARQNVDISLEEANEVMGIPKPIAIRYLLDQKYSGEITEQLIDQIHQDFVQSMVSFYREDPSVKEKQGASRVFGKLRDNNIKIALDTGFDRKTADAILERLDWTGLVDCTVTSDEVKHGRPHPDMIFKAMEQTGIEDVKAVVKVGDTVSDLQQGSSAGCRYVVGVTSGACTGDELVVEPHTHLIENLEELLPIIGFDRAAYQWVG